MQRDVVHLLVVLLERGLDQLLAPGRVGLPAGCRRELIEAGVADLPEVPGADAALAAAAVAAVPTTFKYTLFHSENTGRQNNGIFLPSGWLYFAVDRLSGSGIDNLTLGQDPNVRPLSQDFTIGFAGNIELSVAGSLSLAAHRYRAIAPGALTITPFDPAATAVALGAPVVDLEAAHVSFGGYSFNGRRALDTTMQVNDAVLTVTGHRGLDLIGNTALQNFASASFSTDGDLRMYTPVGRNLSQDATRAVPGSLFTSGELTLAAAQIYPASGNRFLLSAVGPEARTIRFEQTVAAPARLPLSAGGSLLVNAAVIEQAGTLRAPSGLIQLGVADISDAATLALFGGLPVADAGGNPIASGGTLPLVATTDVRLEAGSLTSVSSAGLVVPYGFTVDGRDLQYDVVFGSQLPASASLLGAPPAKRVVIEGVNLDLQDGATVDLSGGGDLQSQEFVPGIGGSRDVLAPIGTLPGTSTEVSLFPDGREVYAIIPGYTSAAGAYDPAIDTRGAGALVGQSVLLRSQQTKVVQEAAALRAQIARAIESLQHQRDELLGQQFLLDLSRGQPAVPQRQS